MKTGFSNRIHPGSPLRTALALLLILVLLATALLSIRLSAFGEDRGDRISLTGGGVHSSLRVYSAPGGLRAPNDGNDKPAETFFKVYDKNKVWETETPIDIFRRSYTGTMGITPTVLSRHGDHVVAPGTTGVYRWTLENTSELPLSYTMNIESWQDGFRFDLPMQARVFNATGEYLLGSSFEWEDIKLLDGLKDEKTLDPGKSMQYTLEWRWPFEQASGDWLDTAFGNQSAYSPVTLGVKIFTTATAEEPVPTPVPTPKPTPEAIEPQPVPAAVSDGRAWALVNLISTILASLIAVYELVIFLRGHKDDESRSEEQNTKLKKRRRSKIWDLLPMAASIITFLLTEDMRLPMTLVDKWTILMLIYLGASVGVGCFTRLKKKKEKIDEELPVS